MKLVKLKELIRLVDNRNTNLEHKKVMGISIKKLFIETKANMEGVSLSNYKIVSPSQFAYVTVTSRNGEKLSLGLNFSNEKYLVSSTYLVFECDEKQILPEYLFLFFNREEFDRYSRFHSWGSARETFDWNDLINMEIPYISLEEQKKYVSIYKALQKNQKSYEDSLNDLQLICDAYIENLTKTETKKKLGDYIETVDNRNTDLKIDNLLGISVNKVFIPTKSKKDDLNLSSYKIVKQREFSFVTVTSRNGGKISIALLNGQSGIVSATYNVFKVSNSDLLLPEFLHLWFSRLEFDRYTRFHSWGSARETFNWDDMCNVMLPIPNIEKQKAIVTIYHTLETRKRLNEELKASLKPLCPILMKGVRDKIMNN